MAKQLTAQYCLARLIREGATYREITRRSGVASNTIAKIVKGGAVGERVRGKLYQALIDFLSERKENARAEAERLRAAEQGGGTK